jgi:hypothetical protein
VAALEIIEREVIAPINRDLLKTNDQLLSEFADGTLSEIGLLLLNKRGCRDQLLSMCSSDAEREGVWCEFFLNEEITRNRTLDECNALKFICKHKARSLVYGPN